MNNEELQLLYDKVASLERQINDLTLFSNKYEFSSRVVQNKFGDFPVALKPPAYSSLPTTCETGQIGSYAGDVYICSATNTWTQLADLPVEDSYISLTAGETLVQGNAVYVSDGENDTSQSDTSVSSSVTVTTSDTWYSQSFTVPAGTWVGIKKVMIGLTHANAGTQTYDWRLSIRANSGGSPTGADIGSLTADASTTGSTSRENIEFTFSDYVPVTGGTTYHLVLRVTSSINSGQYPVVVNGTAGSTGVKKSIDAGGSWSAENGPFYHTIYISSTYIGRVYKTDSDTAGKYEHFIGFARGAISSGVAGNISIAGAPNIFTGLTLGSYYYISGTAGDITVSDASPTRKVGIAISTTRLLITNNW